MLPSHIQKLLYQHFGGHQLTPDDRKLYMKLTESWCEVIWEFLGGYIEKSPMAGWYVWSEYRIHKGDWTDATFHDYLKGESLESLGWHFINPLSAKLLIKARKFGLPMKGFRPNEDPEVIRSGIQGTLDRMLEEEEISGRLHSKLSQEIGLSDFPEIAEELNMYVEEEEDD